MDKERIGPPEPAECAEGENLKIKACEGKKRGDRCYWTCNGIRYTGWCRWNELAWEPTLYCSDRQGRQEGEE